MKAATIKGLKGKEVIAIKCKNIVNKNRKNTTKITHYKKTNHVSAILLLHFVSELMVKNQMQPKQTKTYPN